MSGISFLAIPMLTGNRLQVKVFAWSPFWPPILLVSVDPFTNQVDSFKILGAMATKMVATWRIDWGQKLLVS